MESKVQNLQDSTEREERNDVCVYQVGLLYNISQFSVLLIWCRSWEFTNGNVGLCNIFRDYFPLDNRR
jgi:hypothetical protein